MNLNEYLAQLVKKKDLDQTQAQELLKSLVDPDAPDVLTGAILTALQTKGESVEEIAGFIVGMREKMVSIEATASTIDIVGTGGDGSNTFNISTASSFVLAGAGIPVAKHGNRAASSKCGSADVLEELGVNITLSPQRAQSVLQKTGIVFLFAPLYHPAMKKVGPVRKELGIRTIFNFLGPFLNPAQVKKAIIGVPDIQTARKLSQVAKVLDYEHLLIVTSHDGMDEITSGAEVTVFEIRLRTIKEFKVNPEDFGFAKYSKEELHGGDATQNALILKSILSGEPGVKRDTVLLNTAFALYVAGRVSDIKNGIKIARESIDSGKALETMQSLIKETNL